MLAQFITETGAGLAEHHARHLRRDARLAADRADPARQGHLARCRLRRRRRSGRDHPGLWRASTRSARSPSASSPASLCALAVGLKYKFGFDDSLDVVGVHLVGGLVGTIADRPVRPRPRRAGGIDGLFYGGGLDARSATRRCGALFADRLVRRRSPRSSRLAIKYTIGWRIDEEDEVEGIDFAEHGETAYDLDTADRRLGAAGRSPTVAAADRRQAKEPTHEARHRGDQAAQVGGRPRGPRDLRRDRHDRQRGQRLRPAEGPHRGLPGRGVRHRPGAEDPDRDRRRRRRRRGRRRHHRRRPRRPAGSATARCGSARSRPWSGSAPATATTPAI